MSGKSGTPQASTAQRLAEAARSAGRAGGYCWVENADGPGHCTRPPSHPGRHRDFYFDTDFN